MKALGFAVFIALALAQTAHAANLAKDGGFESPTVPVGGETSFVVGQKIGDWVVIGEESKATVSVVSSSFQANGITFNAHSGQQFLNLSDFGDESEGVVQTITTTPGTTYTVSFWVGAVYDNTGGGPYGSFGTMSRVDIFIGNLPATSVLVRGARESSAQIWQKFSFQFTATEKESKLLFMNVISPAGNVGLDDVKVEQAT